MRVTFNIENILANNKNNKNKNKKNGSNSSSAARSQRISGMGAYTVDDLKKSLNQVVKQGLKGAGRAGGAYLGSQIGLAKSGAKLGAGVGARISKLIGTGDYATSVDVAMNSLVRPGATQYASFADSKTSVRMCHREYLQDAFTGGVVNTFNSTSFQINPGLSNTFPFLSQIANNFEEYKIHGLVFEYVSTTSPYNSTSAMGSVIMAMEYNANSAPYTSKPQMENSDFAISARPDKSMIYGVECADNATNHLFIRSGPTTLPLTTTDLGLFQFATLTPLAINTTLGEIWVSYDIELFRPKISPFKPGYYHLAATFASLAAGAIVRSSYTVVRPAGTSPIAPAAAGSLSGVTLSPSTTTITLSDVDVGDVIQVVGYVSGVSVLAQALNVSGSAGLTLLSVYANYTAVAEAEGSTLGASITATIRVDTNASAQTLTFSTTQAIAAAGTFDIIINSIGNGQNVSVL